MTIPTRFVKMAGGGNDFLLFEADGRTLSEEDRRRVALLCRRGLSVGADGALFLSGGGEGRVRLDYFNADGGLASFCANGTRCAARYAATRRLVAGNSPVLETGWAVIPARVEGELVTLELPPVAPPGIPVAVSGDGLPATGIPIEVGVPHLVVFVAGDLEDLPVKSLASAVVAAGEGFASPPIACVTRSGVAFTVSFVQKDGAILDTSLAGDAREI